jgi:hypothetical protein
VVSSSALTVDQYLAELPIDRQRDVRELVSLVRESLPPGYQEVMAWGMIGYQVPMEISGPTYNGQPIGPVAIASQKQHISIYLLAIYASEDLTAEFQKRWSASGKRLNMGKSCVRFSSLEKADLDTIRWAVSLFTPGQFAELYLAARKSRKGS